MFHSEQFPHPLSAVVAVTQWGHSPADPLQLPAKLMLPEKDTCSVLRGDRLQKISFSICLVNKNLAHEIRESPFFGLQPNEERLGMQEIAAKTAKVAQLIGASDTAQVFLKEYLEKEETLGSALGMQIVLRVVLMNPNPAYLDGLVLGEVARWLESVATDVLKRQTLAFWDEWV